MMSGVIILEAYFIATYIIGNTLMTDVKDLLPEFNYTAYSESLYIFADNSLRNFFMNPTSPIFNVISYATIMMRRCDKIVGMVGG